MIKRRKSGIMELDKEDVIAEINTDRVKREVRNSPLTVGNPVLCYGGVYVSFLGKVVSMFVRYDEVDDPQGFSSSDAVREIARRYNERVNGLGYDGGRAG